MIKKGTQHLHTTKETEEDDNQSVQTNQSDISNISTPTITERGWAAFQLNLMNKETSLLTNEHECMKEWILLDNGSTVDLFSNSNLVTNINTTNELMELATNTGTKTITSKAEVPKYGRVWYDPDAITNIFGLCNLIKKYRVTFDSDKENAFVVHMPNKPIKFIASPNGLYYFKPSYKTGISNMVSTVNENRKNYTNRQFDRAKLARKLYHIVGAPSVQNFKALIKMNAIANCPVTIEDVNIAEDIFGPDISTLKGKSTRPKTKVVVNDEIEIPNEIIEKNYSIELCVDTMCVNGMAFTATID